MKGIILAAGYATRLYPLTKNQAKPLLEVGGKPIIQYQAEILEKVPEIQEICVVTNHKFFNDFMRWKMNSRIQKKITILNDGTFSENDKLGSLGDLLYVIEQQRIQDDILVMAGDNLFGFSIREFISFFRTVNSTIIAFHDLKDLEKVKRKYGVGVLEGTRIIKFQEKPQDPVSTLASTCCYILPQETFPVIKQYVTTYSSDDIGTFFSWFNERKTVHGFVFNEHWFDIGSHETLLAARKFYQAPALFINEN